MRIILFLPYLLFIEVAACQIYISNFSNPTSTSACDGTLTVMSGGTAEVSEVMLFQLSGVKVKEGVQLEEGFWYISNICAGSYEVRVFNGSACLSKALPITLLPCTDPVFTDIEFSAFITPVSSGNVVWSNGHLNS